MNIESIIFFIFGTLSVISAILMITRKNPIMSAIFLILNFLTIAVIYLLLRAQFIAIIQVLIYMGAIMVLFLFVIMLLNIEDQNVKGEIFSYKKLSAILISVLFMLLLGSVFYFGFAGKQMNENAEKFGMAEYLGKTLFLNYSFHILAAGILLLAAVVGAVILAKKNFE